MTTITYDVDSKSSLYGKTFCQINDDASIILMDRPFIHSIGFISYAMSHESATATLSEIQGYAGYNKSDLLTKANTMHDYFACKFHAHRKGRGAIDSNIYNPIHLWNHALHSRGLYTPPTGKYFMVYSKYKIQMLIAPAFKTIVFLNGPKFGRMFSYSLTEYLNVKELLQKYPEYKPHREYLQWLEDEMNAGNIKMKGNSISINQQKLKEFL